jgi:hypothetical protein
VPSSTCQLRSSSSVHILTETGHISNGVKKFLSLLTVLPLTTEGSTIEMTSRSPSTQHASKPPGRPRRRSSLHADITSKQITSQICTRLSPKRLSHWLSDSVSPPFWDCFSLSRKISVLNPTIPRSFDRSLLIPDRWIAQ